MNIVGGPGLHAGFIPLRGGARELPLFLVQSRHGPAAAFSQLAERGNAGFPILGLLGRAAESTPSHIVQERASYLIETIRAIQPQGPYRLVAWPKCALVAYEIGAQLLGRGRK